MAEPTFDYERLDVYRLSIEFVAFSYQIARTLDGANRQAVLERIILMLTRLIQRTQAVAKDRSEYEYRDAEHQYEAIRTAETYSQP